MIKIKKYYVYLYLDPRKQGKFVYGKYKFEYEPFYVGKGFNKRCLVHLGETSGNTCNVFKHRVINKIRDKGLESIIIKLKENISNNYAYKLETKLIELIGRRCNKSGPLTNILTDIKPPSNYINLDNKTIKKIINLYNKGWFIKHIAIEIKVSETKINSVLIENGIITIRKPPINRIEINVNTLKKMISDYNSGLSIRSLCDKYKLTFEVVRRRLKENKVKLRGYDYPKTKEHINKMIRTMKKNNLVGEKSKSYVKLGDDIKAKIIELRSEEFLTIWKIAKKLGLGYQKTYSSLKELGLSTKRIK